MATSLIALHDGKTAWRLTEAAVPVPQPGFVTLRVRASGVCGSDLHYYPLRTEPETVPGGHEIAAEVEFVGQGVTALRPGDRVAPEMVGLVRACTSCWFCRAGEYVKCTSPRQRQGGGFAQRLTVPARACFMLADTLTWEEGALVEPLAVAVHGYRRAQFKPFETAVVLGSGTIGLAQIAAVRGLGARRVIATARYPAQADMAKRLGADFVLPAEDEKLWMDAASLPADRMADRAIPAAGSPLWDAVADATDGRGADAVFECVGGTSGTSLNQAIAIARKGGRVVSVGAPKSLVPVNVIIMLRRELSLILSHCYSVSDGRHDFEIAADLIARGAAPVGPLVTHRFPLEQINAAVKTAGDKKAGALKVHLLP
jgi:threonine dehydrogenase-like Zn-dependent dehydrogenase